MLLAQRHVSPRTVISELPMIDAGVAKRWARRSEQQRLAYVGGGILALLLFAFLVRGRPTAGSAAALHDASSMAAKPWKLSQTGGKPATLIVYIFSNTDEEYIGNLRHFVQFGITEGDGCEYALIIQKDQDKETPALPPLPSNARYLEHENSCYDWGTVGWALKNGHIDPSLYKYFIIMNSSIRGPFMPTYTHGVLTWQDALLSRLTDTVKLVGATISCEGSPYQGNVAGEWRSNPHVQSYVLATDSVGFDVWLKDKNVFGCWDSMWDVIWHGELGSSLAMLRAGYNLESMMTRYEGVDWRDEANWRCNGLANPYGEHYADGISLSPHEVMFVKVKDKVLANEWSFAVQAQKYSKYMRDAANGTRDVLSNEYRTNPRKFQLQKLGYLYKRGPQCFDTDYYLKANPDLGGFTTPEQLWGHFLRGGAFEGRPFRWTCSAIEAIPQPQ